jgi:hypothetical protein
MTMHYANGREAKIGDQVVGYGYNTVEADKPRLIAGTLVKATPGQDRCNAEIEWVEIRTVDQVVGFQRPRMAQGDPRLVTMPGATQPVVQAHFVCRDYTHCGALLHIEDVAELVAHDGYMQAFPKGAH